MIVVEFCPFDEAGYITVDKLKVGDVYFCLCDQEQKTKSMVSAKLAYVVDEVFVGDDFVSVQASEVSGGFGQSYTYFPSDNDEHRYVYLVGEEYGIKIE